jgi:CheY-like chemotaxis protein
MLGPMEENMDKILIVDDNVLNLDILKEALQDTFTLSMAKNGKIALKILDRIKPDLVLLDVMMPVMDGYETYKAIVNDEKYDNMPIIFLSALEEIDEDILKLDTSRDVSFIKKPFDLKEVLQKINEVMDLDR